MRFLKQIACMIAVAAISCGCAKDYWGEREDLVLVEGKVTDEDGSPIEKIKVSFIDEASVLIKSVYTSNKGEYECLIEADRFEDKAVISVLFEDIDGNQNYGLFESANHPISSKDTKKDEDGFMIVNLDCRLIRATPLENTRQF